MKSNLADYLEVWGLENEIILFSDGSLGFGLECTPVDCSSWGNEKLNEFADKTREFLNALPEKSDLQILQEIEPQGSGIIDRHLSLIHESSSMELRRLTECRATILREQIAQGQLPEHKLKIFVRRDRKQSQLNKPKFLSKETEFPQILEQELQVEVNAFRKLRDNLQEELSSLEIESEIIDSNQVAECIYWQWNPGRPVGLNGYDPEDIRTSFLFSDVSIQVAGFLIGRVHHRVLSLKILPDQTQSCMATILRQLPFKSRVFVSVHIPNQIDELQGLQTQRRIAYSMVVGKKEGVSDIESQAKLTDLEGLIEQMVSQGEKVFNVSLNIVLRSENEDLLEEQVAQSLQVIRELGGAEGLIETYAAFDIFSQTSIPNARSKERAKKIKTSNLRDLLPVYGPWKGHSSPRVLLKSRVGSLFCFDPFDSSLSSANQLVSGGSGAGKSFATNLILLQLIKENPKVFFVDIGGSYKRLTQILGGQNTDLGLGTGLSINPFDLAENELEPSPHKIKFLMGLIEIMTKDFAEQTLPRLVRAELEQAILDLYRANKKPKLSDLRAILLTHEEVDIRRYGKMLSQWCGETPYGQFIDRETNVQFNRDIVAFDLKGLESYPDLQAVCLYIITDLIWREVQKDRFRQKYVVFDECWKLLKDESPGGMLTFLEEVFRTFRKYYASAIALSQDLSDFANSKIASALIPNCPVKWILIQNRSDLSRMTEVLGLNPNEVALIQSLEQKKGFYSEAFLVSGQKNRSVVVVEPTPLDLWLATTDPRDLSTIEKQRKETPEKSDWEIIELLSKKHPHGISV